MSDKIFIYSCGTCTHFLTVLLDCGLSRMEGDSEMDISMPLHYIGYYFFNSPIKYHD